MTSLSGYTPNVEAIARYRPDLVVVYLDNGGIVGHLEKLHIPVLLEPPAANLSGAYAQIEQLGVAVFLAVPPGVEGGVLQPEVGR